MRMFLENNDDYIKVDFLDIESLPKNINPNSKNLSSIKKFITHISELEKNSNKINDIKSKEEMNSLVLSWAKSIKKTRRRKVFWINSNVYVLEKILNDDFIEILFCNKNGYSIDSISTRQKKNFNKYNGLINIISIKNTTFEIYKDDYLWYKKIIIRQYDSDRVRGVISKLFRNSMRDFKRFF